MDSEPKVNGRPKKIPTEDQIRQIEGLAAVLTAEQIASFIGMARSTFFERLKDTPEMAEAFERGAASGVARISNALVKKAMNGDTTAMIFYLKCKGGWRETKNLALTGGDGGPIKLEGRAIDETKLTFEQQKALLAAVVKDESDEG